MSEVEVVLAVVMDVISVVRAVIGWG